MQLHARVTEWSKTVQSYLPVYALPCTVWIIVTWSLGTVFLIPLLWRWAGSALQHQRPFQNINPKVIWSTWPKNLSCNLCSPLSNAYTVPIFYQFLANILLSSKVHFCVNSVIKTIDNLIVSNHLGRLCNYLFLKPVNLCSQINLRGHLIW
jgi:hypothetical protein